MSGTVLPVPGLSPALATRCRDSPAAGLVAAVSRDEEDAWKRKAGQTLSAVASPGRSSSSTGGGHGGGLGGTDTRCFCFLAGRCTWPAREPHASPRRRATAGSGRWLPAQPDKKGCRGGEDMNQSGVPSPAGGSWPVRQLPITQPGSVYSRSTTPHRLLCQAGEGNVLLGWGWHSRCALFGDSPPPRPPGAAVARGLL